MDVERCLSTTGGNWVCYTITVLLQTPDTGLDFSIPDPNPWTQLNCASTKTTVRLGTLEYCPPTIGYCFEVWNRCT